MTNIRLEMNFYRCAKQYVVMVLFDDEEGVSSSHNWYFIARGKAAKQLATLEKQYNLQGSIHE